MKKRKIVIIVEDDGDGSRTDNLCSHLSNDAAHYLPIVESYVDYDYKGEYETQEEYDNKS